MELNSKLAEFMHIAAARRFQWGEFDCALWLADWFVYATGKEYPAEYLRKRYSDELGCKALFGNAAAARMVRETARRAGLSRTDDPFLGDIGVIEIPLPKQIICGAIRSRVSWTVLIQTKGVQRIPDDQCRTVMAYRIEETDAPSRLLGIGGSGGRLGSLRPGGGPDRLWNHNTNLASR